MAVKDKFEMLDAVIGSIDEKYIKKADKLLSERAEIDRQVIKLVPEKWKFSWKSFIAAAASLAVLVTCTVAAVNFVRSKNPIVVTPVNDNLTPEQQAYLDEWKENLGSSINIAYAVDRLNFIEIELPDDVTGLNFIDENQVVFIRDETRTLEIYNIKEKTYTVAAELNGDAEKIWCIGYADQNYVVYQGLYPRSGPWGPEDVYLYDVNTKQSRLIYTEQNKDNEITGVLAAYGKVYIDVCDNSYNSENGRRIHIYDIASDTELVPIDYAYYPRCYNGDIFYSSTVDGRVKSLSGKYDLDETAIVSKFGLFNLDENVGLRDLEYDSEELNDRYKFKARIEQDHLNSYDVCDFAFKFGLSNITVTHNPKFLYYAPTNEILVFQGGDGFREPQFFGWGGYISKIEPDGTVREFIFTDKKSENTVKIPKLDPKPEVVDPEQQYLDEIREELNVSSSVGVAYARDRLNITNFSLPWDTTYAIDSGTLFIDSNHALVSDIVLLDKIEMYTLDTKEYTTLISAESDPLADENTLYNIYYANSDYIVFDRRTQTEHVNKIDLCVMELKKDGYPCTTIGSDLSAWLHPLFIDENTIYFTSYGGSNIISQDMRPAIYRYEIGYDEEPVLCISEGVPLCVYKDELLYYTMEEGSSYWSQVEIDYSKRIIHSAGGKLPIDNQPYTGNMWACKYGVFKLDGGKLVNCLTDQVIFSSDHNLSLFPLKQTDFGIVIGPVVQYIYNANTNEVLVFKEGDIGVNSLNWRSCHWGVCNDDGTLISQKENGRPMKEYECSYSEYGIPRVFIPTNDDTNYPLNIWLDIDPDSISFKKYDEPVYGFEEYLDGDNLEFVLNISLKENFYKYDTCELSVDGYEVTIDKDGAARVPGLKIGDGGQLSVTLLTDTEECDYASTFNIQAELDSTIVVEIFYGLAYEGGRLISLV